jgi:hypothetical protein
MNADEMKQVLYLFDMWQDHADSGEFYEEITAVRKAIEQAEFDKAFDEYAKSDEGKARTKAVFKQSFDQSIDKLIEHVKTKQKDLL